MESHLEQVGSSFGVMVAAVALLFKSHLLVPNDNWVIIDIQPGTIAVGNLQVRNWVPLIYINPGSQLLFLAW
jgi:hypothetical protein